MITETQNKEIEINYISTESHGYAILSRYDLKGWQIDPCEFSEFSYYNFETACVYLEEDCDLPKLHKLLREKGFEVSFNESHANLFFNHPNFTRLTKQFALNIERY